MTGPNDPGRQQEPAFQPSSQFQPGPEVQDIPRRRRQPVLTAAALIGIILLVLALVIFGGI